MTNDLVTYSKYLLSGYCWNYQDIDQRFILAYIQKLTFWAEDIHLNKCNLISSRSVFYLFISSWACGIQEILQPDWFLEKAEFSHPDRNSGRNPSSWYIFVNESAVIVNLSPFLQYHTRLINASLSPFKNCNLGLENVSLGLRPYCRIQNVIFLINSPFIYGYFNIPYLLETLLSLSGFSGWNWQFRSRYEIGTLGVSVLFTKNMLLISIHLDEN